MSWVIVLMREIKQLNFGTALTTTRIKLLMVVWILLIVEVNMDHNAVLSSVYDVMKLNRLKAASQLNKNRRYSVEPFYEVVKESEEENWPVVKYEVEKHPQSKPQHVDRDYICHIGHEQHMKHEMDMKMHEMMMQEQHNKEPWGKIASTFFTVFKLGAAVVGFFVMPLLLLQAFLFPLRVLFAFKALIFFNTILIGTFFYRVMFGDGFASFFKNFGFKKSDASKKEVATTSEMPEIKVNFDDEDERRQAKMILKYIKRKNKRW